MDRIDSPVVFPQLFRAALSGDKDRLGLELRYADASDLLACVGPRSEGILHACVRGDARRCTRYPDRYSAIPVCTAMVISHGLESISNDEFFSWMDRADVQGDHALLLAERIAYATRNTDPSRTHDVMRNAASLLAEFGADSSRKNRAGKTTRDYR